MTAAVIALAVALAGVIGLLAFAVAKAFSAKDAEVLAMRDLGDSDRQLRATQADLQAMSAKATVLASSLEDQKEHAKKLARQAALAENHRDALLQKLAEGGDPGSVAASIRSELAELQKLSAVPIPTGDAPTAPTGPSRRPGPVHD